MVWRHSSPFHFSSHSFWFAIHGPLYANYKIITLFPSVPTFPPPPSKHESPPTPISTGAREPPPSPRVIIGHISVFIALQSKWILSEVGFSNFLPQRKSTRGLSPEFG
ncbi:hypothetical protein AVEN_152224-1 [Araneus ventricosus]|uniref:Uncharacterized protein n=1 Tax=Araneus ventricosus TaxID=182803 RepID=A0A4Y2SLC3_ARAVE|nr:hypothetical protein AVEN_77117-1 [Araneus ventricosus]GBN87964.1 hypothetical protein AVEN_152224-1 [Araneus ventricosus]